MPHFTFWQFSFLLSINSAASAVTMWPCGNCVYLCLVTVFKVISKARRLVRSEARPGRGQDGATAASLSHESLRQFNALHLTFGICSDPGPWSGQAGWACLRQEFSLCAWLPECVCGCVCAGTHIACVLCFAQFVVLVLLWLSLSRPDPDLVSGRSTSFRPYSGHVVRPFAEIIILFNDLCSVS